MYLRFASAMRAPSSSARRMMRSVRSPSRGSWRSATSAARLDKGMFCCRLRGRSAIFSRRKASRSARCRSAAQSPWETRTTSQPAASRSRVRNSEGPSSRRLATPATAATPTAAAVPPPAKPRTCAPAPSYSTAIISDGRALIRKPSGVTKSASYEPSFANEAARSIRACASSGEGARYASRSSAECVLRSRARAWSGEVRWRCIDTSCNFAMPAGPQSRKEAASASRETVSRRRAASSKSS
mmetsp:Transcript_18169/g.62714  ORF Transcript_18169/g.62714 Transcript_18169/m.62714 type:complete len:242 (+) Transcript_18169:286-1011(+)